MSYKMMTLLILSALIFPDASRAAEKVLIPLNVGSVPGAHGSLWTTEVIVHNPTGERVPSVSCTGSIGGFPRSIPARATETFLPGYSPIPPVFACFERELVFNLRVRDLSRQSLTWGTEVPVIRTKDLLAEVVLAGVPTDARFRQTLRVYNWSHDESLWYSVQALSPEGAVLLERTLVPLQIQTHPGYAEIIDIVGQHPELGSSELVTLRIAPSVPDLGIWGFVSVTNNETQHVTTITPD